MENNAKVVDHPWDTSIAYVIDDGGKVHENLQELQAPLNSVEPFDLSQRHLTGAGAAESTKLAFDLPKDTPHAFVMVRGELLMGHMFDGKAFARTRIQLK